MKFTVAELHKIKSEIELIEAKLLEVGYKAAENLAEEVDSEVAHDLLSDIQALFTLTFKGRDVILPPFMENLLMSKIGIYDRKLACKRLAEIMETFFLPKIKIKAAENLSQKLSHRRHSGWSF